MQTVIWNGVGEGTLANPFILESDGMFDREAAFNINLKNNYLAEFPTYTYFQIDDVTTIYLLAILLIDRKGTTLYEAKEAINYTLLLSDKVDYIDGPFSINVYQGVTYILKQQLFDIKRLKEGRFVGFWEALELYYANDMVVYQNVLYVSLIDQATNTFITENWMSISVNKSVISSDIAPTAFGAKLWIKPTVISEEGGYPYTTDLQTPEPEMVVLEDELFMDLMSVFGEEPPEETLTLDEVPPGESVGDTEPIEEETLTLDEVPPGESVGDTEPIEEPPF